MCLQHRGEPSQQRIRFVAATRQRNSARDPTLLDFLPYHFLLVSAGDRGDLTWRDITHGTEVAEHRTKMGPATCLRQNPKNAVMHLGHDKGSVTLWTPTIKEPVVKMACHNAKVTALAVTGNYMVTAGAEAKWKVWDLRTYKELHSYYRQHGHGVNSMDVSMTGMLAMCCGGFFEVFKDVFSTARETKPYIKEQYKGRQIECVRYRPFEDVCCVGRSDGFGSLVVPGAGKANFDSFEANPFETKSQRREREVQSLLEKLQPDSIMLNPDDIGQIDREVVKVWRDNSKKEEEAKAKEEAAKKKPVKKMRGKNKVGNRMKRKALKQGAEGRQKARNRLAGEKAEDAPRGATGRGFRRNEGDESDFHSPMNLEDAWADEAQRLLRQHRQNCDLEPLNIFAPRPRPVKRPFETLETAFQVTCQVMVALLSPRVHPWMRRLSACLRMQRTYPEVLPAPSLSVLVSGFHAKLVLDVANRLSLPPFRWAQYRPEPEDLLCPLTVHGLELNLLGAVAGVFIGRAAVEARQVLQGLACVAASMLPVSFQSMFLDRTVPFAAPCAALFFHMSSCAVLSPFVVSSMATLLQEAQLHRCLILSTLGHSLRRGLRRSLKRRQHG
ncbi:unnamed protein product [Durusdinium trenchii]|uniref:BING4 C-terminal domain-containing protein n=1 Tax=Durusdinium trenchii TaxID=1381693 RepID=A0ABP0KDZ8_9DINO